MRFHSGTKKNPNNITNQNKANQKTNHHFLTLGICFIGIVFFGSLSSLPVWAAPGQFCFESIACSQNILISQPWTTARSYFDSIIPSINGASLTITIFWGVLIGIIWLRSQSPTLVMIVGIIVATTGIGFNQIAVGLGLMLASVALGVILFQILRQRTSVLSF